MNCFHFSVSLGYKTTATGYKPAGIVHQNEWVAPPWMLQQPRTAKVIDYLESIRQGKTTPMAEGGYSDSNFVNKSQDISTNADTSNADYVQFISALMQVKDLLQKLYDEGITLFCIPKILKNESNSQLSGVNVDFVICCFVSQRY